MPSHDVGSGHLMDVSARDDCVGEVGEGREEELVDYGSTSEFEAQRVPLHTMKCKRRSMSSRKRALAAMRYSF